jgi:hypothetical protein
MILNNPMPRGPQPKNIKKGTTQPSATITQVDKENYVKHLKNGKRTDTHKHVLKSSPMTTIGQKSFHSFYNCLPTS